jgi:hypothetical protein
MNVLRKIVGKTKIDRIRSQQIRESCSIQLYKATVRPLMTYALKKCAET